MPSPSRHSEARRSTLLISGALIFFSVGLLAHAFSSSRAAFDRYGRLNAYPGKVMISCPPQTNRTAVLLALGQSNIANETGQRRESAFGDKVAALSEDRCMRAASPLFGSTGMQGEPLTLIGNKLIESDAYDQVILAPLAIGGTAISRWARGDLNPLLRTVVSEITGRYRVTHVLWHQGESDAETSGAGYAADFHNILHTLRDLGVGAPIYVSVTTYCTALNPRWHADNDVARAQRRLPDPRIGVRAGVDTDDLLQPADRFDDCHLGASGQEKFASALVGLLTAVP